MGRLGGKNNGEKIIESLDRKTARQHDTKTLRRSIMYISEILQYLIWPGFILLAWILVKFVLSAYEKKFPEEE